MKYETRDKHQKLAYNGTSYNDNLYWLVLRICLYKSFARIHTAFWTLQQKITKRKIT